MSTPMKHLATLLTIWFVLAAVDARADLITNGSFESTTTPAVSAGSFQNFGPGSTGIPGWTVVGAAGTNVSVVSTTDVESGISYPAEQGSFWLDLTGDASNSDTEGVEQTVSTTIGDQCFCREHHGCREWHLLPCRARILLAGPDRRRLKLRYRGRRTNSLNHHRRPVHFDILDWKC